MVREKSTLTSFRKKEVKERFKIKLRNRFAVLQGKITEINNNELTIEKKLENIKSAYNETAEKVLGYKDKHRTKMDR